jgi:hypothetical protein
MDYLKRNWLRVGLCAFYLFIVILGFLHIDRTPRPVISAATAPQPLPAAGGAVAQRTDIDRVTAAVADAAKSAAADRTQLAAKLAAELQFLAAELALRRDRDAPAALTDEDRWKAQAALNAKGFRSGWCDGKDGNIFAEAVRKFQASLGAAQDGILTRDQVHSLFAGTAAPCRCHDGDFCPAATAAKPRSG